MGNDKIDILCQIMILHPLPPLEKLTGAEPVSRPKTIKSILKSKSTFKAEILKSIIINEPSSAPARGNKSSPVSKTNSASVETRTLNRIISLRRGIKPRNPQHVTKNCETCGSNVHTTFDHNDIEWFRKREALQAKKIKSFKANDEVPTNMALMAFSDSEVNNDKTCSNTCLKSFEALKTQLNNLRVEFNKSEFNLATYKGGLASVEEQLVFYKKDEIEKLKKDKESNQIKIDNFKNASKSLDKLIGSQISNNNRKGYGFKANKSVCENSSNEIKKTTDAPIIKDWVSDCNEDDSKVMVLKSDNVQHKPEKANQPKKMVQKPVLNNVKKGTGQKKVRPVWNNAMRVNHQNFSNSRRNFVSTAVLTKSGIVPVSAARPINTDVPKSFVNVAKNRPNSFQKSHSLSRRPFYQQTTLKNRNLNDKVNTAKINSINTAKGNRVTSSVGEQGINAIKSSACWVWRPKIKADSSLKLKGYLINNGYADLVKNVVRLELRGG
ncbi:hypothetical protein Tco_0643783 [Tanacetum coccineum]